jgi:hypothetical protein
VDAVGPDVEVVAIRQVALLVGLVLLLPRGCKARDRGGREARRPVTEQGGQALFEIARGKAAQVEDRQRTSATLGERRM